MLRVLHVASFRGNIGDNANHAGFRPWFESMVGCEVVWSEFEIRDVYRSLRSFDMAFATEANRYDLLIIGGGNYFELWVEHSPTGTSFSITDEALAALTVPVFYNALGVDAGQGVTANARHRFGRFLATILASERNLVSVRNDGSWNTLLSLVSDMDLDRVLHLPDAGFFARYGPAVRRSSPAHLPVLGINIAGDMLEGRFPGGDRNNYDAFLSQFAGFMVNVHQEYGATFILFPHIFRDLKVYADLLAILPDAIRREFCRVAPYDVGDLAAEEIFSAYQSCQVVLGMRFHANVVAIGSGVHCIGLACYDQIRFLFEGLEETRLAIDVQNPGFATRLHEITRWVFEQPEEALAAQQRMIAHAQRLRLNAEPRLRHWLQRNQIVR
jgi:polysaccharide pyruvyl transferase WcaK-like protein